MMRLSRLGVVIFVALTASAAAFAAPGGAMTFNEKISGVVQKPTIDIVLSRQNLAPKYTLVLKESFLPKILESINQKPF